MNTRESRTHAPQALVVGAGIAGLSAAYTLAKAGLRVKVLEASSRVGGRMTTETVDSHVVDCGAQFLSSGYGVLLSLAADLGLQSQLRETSPWSAIVRAGKLRRVRADHPLDALSSGLLSFPAWARLGWRSWQLRDALHALPLSDYSRWAGFDTESVSSWSDRTIHHSVTEYLFEPMLHGFYFQEPEATSRALALALAAFGVRRSATLTLAGGIGTLPEAIAAGLDIVRDTPVKSITVAANSASVMTDAFRFDADFVVLAVPAGAAREIHPCCDELSRRLTTTRYSASINVALITDDAFRLPAELAAVYGLLVPRRERRRIAAIGIEANKNRDASAPGQLLNIMLSSTAAESLMSTPDDVLIRQVSAEAETYFPGLVRHLAGSRVYRWPLAEPYSHIGRATDLLRYRESIRPATDRVLLAGDYMSMPTTEGAAESGKWAAEAILGAAR